MDEKGIVVIPTYNESENIAALIDEIHATVPALDVLVVDDNSPDGTAGIVKSCMEKNGRIHLIERPGKLGLGTAYVQGFKRCLEQGYGIIIQMDSDFSHQPKYLLDFLREIKSYDLILGSRYIAQGGTENWSLSRKILSRGGNLYAKMILGLPFRDLTGGFKCFRREVLEAIKLDTVKAEGYSFQIEMTYRAYKLGFRIKEVPIVFPDRTKGVSKLSQQVFFEAVMLPWRIRFKS